ncbi:hypothetical protein MAIT1_01165 [Magnetofaba australis IT-1]|uniref:Uncharacterized protein n=1 Tax=Magnetofaba australis IT-1 TaxID=1434232 RepID=A0A1Y2K9Q5_9PROT|nr:hypothetical protein MAIT1_01165 [Magnetofaba australis IT-1]
MTVNQALGAVLHPITREIAALEEAGITKLKQLLGARRKEENTQRIIEENRDVIDVISSNADTDAQKIQAAERLVNAIDAASEQELDNDEVRLLWRSLLQRMANQDTDTDLLITTLSGLSTAEAQLLLDIYQNPAQRRNPRLIPALRSFIHHDSHLQHDRRDQLATTLKNKKLIYQPLFRTSLPQFMAFFLLFTVLAATLQTLDNTLPLPKALHYFDMLKGPIVPLPITLEQVWGYTALLAISTILIAIMDFMLRPLGKLTWLGKKLCVFKEEAERS